MSPDKKIRISVSQIQSYLSYVNGVISFEQLLNSLLKRDFPSIKMIAGTIFHATIQNLPFVPDSRIVFNPEDIEEAKTKIDRRSEIFEYKIRKPYETTRGEVIVTGVADQIIGDMVCEYKTTYSGFSYDKYAESIQWKAYCNIFGVEQVKYQVWQMTEPSEEYRDNPKPLEVKSYNEFIMYGNQCSDYMFTDSLNGAVEFIYSCGLDKNLLV